MWVCLCKCVCVWLPDHQYNCFVPSHALVHMRNGPCCWY